jgi:hypothetical protein
MQQFRDVGLMSGTRWPRQDLLEPHLQYVEPTDMAIDGALVDENILELDRSGRRRTRTSPMVKGGTCHPATRPAGVS